MAEFELQAEQMINETLAEVEFRKVCDEIWKPLTDTASDHSKAIVANCSTTLKSALRGCGDEREHPRHAVGRLSDHNVDASAVARYSGECRRTAEHCTPPDEPGGAQLFANPSGP